MPRISPEAVTASFSAPIEPIPTNVLYRMAAMFVSCLMILQPLLYLLLIVGVARLVFWHLENNIDLLHQFSRRGRDHAFGMLLYLAPAFIGALLVIFMFKPLLTLRSSRPTGIRLDLDREPLFAAYLQGICTSINAPMPRSVVIDLQINASVGFRRGWFSLFLRDDLELRLGLPLIRFLEARTLAQVVAHEFGHVRQEGGMRAYWVIRTINDWFARVVYLRDRWDRWLEQASRSWDFRISWVLWLARLAIWLSRRFLWCQMLLSHAASSLLSRQMEYDADLVGIRVAGADAVRTGFLRLAELERAWAATVERALQAWQERRLPDDLMITLQDLDEEMPDDLRRQMHKELLAQKAPWFTSHPSPNQRIAAAESHGQEGVCQLTIETRQLWTDFDALCRQATIDFYEQVLGRSFDRRYLVPAQDVRETARVRSGQLNALEHLAGHLGKDISPLRLDPTTWPALPPITQARRLLPQIQQRLQDVNDQVLDHLKAAGQADQSRMQALQALDLLRRANLAINLAQFGLPNDGSKPGSTPAAIQQAANVAERTAAQLQGCIDEAYRACQSAVALVRLRVVAALALLKDPQVQVALPQAHVRLSTVTNRLDLIGRLAAAEPAWEELRESLCVLAIYLDLLQNLEDKTPILQPLQRLQAEIQGRLTAFKDLLGNGDHPYGSGCLAAQVVAGLSAAPMDLEDLHECLHGTIGRFRDLQARLWGEVGQLVQEVELAESRWTCESASQ